MTFKVTDSGSPAQTTSVSLTLTVVPPPLTITTTSLHNGAVSTPYTQALAASGGTGSYTWALVSGTLPNGLSFNSSGQITGTPTAPVSLTPLGFKVTDSASPAQTRHHDSDVDDRTCTAFNYHYVTTEWCRRKSL